ncbi:MAG: DUF6069 family protein [Bacteroidia bacterium]
MNTKLNFKQIITAGAMAAGVSVIINSILFFVLKAAGIFTDDIFIQPNQPLTILPIILSSVMPSLVGASIFFLFEKYSNNGFKIFSIVSIVLMVLSFVNPFMGIPGVTIAYGVALDLMHVVVALSLLYFIKKAKN